MQASKLAFDRRGVIGRSLAHFILCLAACAAEPDLGDSPGTCAINCTQAKIGSTEMRVRFLTNASNDLTISCTDNGNNGAFPRAIPLRFVIEKPRRRLPAEKIDTVDGSTQPTSGEESPADWIPVSGLSFNPLLLAGQGASDNPLDDRDRYSGILTPPAEWCTDSCGVGSIDFQPRCSGNGGQGKEVRLGVHSGGLYGEMIFVFE